MGGASQAALMECRLLPLLPCLPAGCLEMPHLLHMVFAGLAIIVLTVMVLLMVSQA